MGKGKHNRKEEANWDKENASMIVEKEQQETPS